jgi:hypothetical protein
MNNEEQSIFKYGFELLEKRYPKETLHEDIKALYLQHFMENLTSAEFLEAVKHSILNSRFMPTAADLVEYVKGGKEAKAIQEWRDILTASSRTDDLSQLTYVSARAQVALRAIGGLRAVAIADNRDRQRMEKSFIMVYCQCSSKDTQSLPQSISNPSQQDTEIPLEPSPMPDSVKAKLQELKGKYAMNGNRKEG